MKNVLITHSYFLNFDQKQRKQQQPYPPLGTLMACAILREEKFNVYFHDVMFDENTNNIESKIKTLSLDIFVIYDDGFNYLTKMCLSNMREAAFEMIKIAKENNCIVIVCSSDSTDRYEIYLENGANYIIVGEGEITLNVLLKSLNKSENDFKNIEGIIRIENNTIFHHPKRHVLRELDTLPFAAWDLLDISPYRKAWIQSKGYFSLNMYTTRGCPYHCNWCAKPIYGNRYNARSPQKVVEELLELQTRFNFDHIWFCDDIFGLKPGWVEEFVDEIKKTNLVFRFKIQSRVDLLLSESNVKALADAGCEEVWLGAESGSQKILDAMEKGTKIEQIEAASLELKKHGIKPCFFIQFGYPGENAEDIHSTIEMVLKLMPHDIGVSISYPLPGTKFYESVSDQLKEKSNWTDSDELLLMFKNTYQPLFYKELQRYLHRQFRSAQSKQTFYQLLNGEKRINNSTLKKIVAYGIHQSAAKIAYSKLRKLEPAF